MIFVAFTSLSLALAACPKGSMQGPAATDCYQFEYDALSWFDASDECKKLRGTLAPISNAFVNTWINTNANITFNTYWTGGYMKGGSCTWVDGTQCRYTNWAAGKRLHPAAIRSVPDSRRTDAQLGRSDVDLLRGVDGRLVQLRRRRAEALHLQGSRGLAKRNSQKRQNV